ncbi:MAG: hypothetical protein K2M36_05865, partial [Clostridia bacterium]|nr:hypothetical protein [Clostridia bacterium]
LIDMVKDRDFDAANKYVAESKEIAIYGQRFRMFGIIAYSILCRLALTRTEYNMLKKKLLELADEDKSSVQTASGKESADNKGADSDKSKLPSPYQIVFESKNKVEWPIRVEYPKKETQVDYSRKDTQKSIIRQTLIMGQIEANMKDTLSLKNMNLEDGVAELFLPFGTEKIKIVINNDSGKISDSGETFKSSTSKDTIGNAAYEKSIDNLISSFGLTKRTKGKSILLEKQFGSEKTLLQDVLAMYNVICMIRQISVLAAAFPDGNN